MHFECSKKPEVPELCGVKGLDVLAPVPSRDRAGRCNSSQRNHLLRSSWILAVVLMLFLSFSSSVRVQGQSAEPEKDNPSLGEDLRKRFSKGDLVDHLMAHMSPADKIGQLFLVPFTGPGIHADDDILNLIHSYRVGGVILSERNQNLDNRTETDTPRQVASLTRQLQAAAHGYWKPAVTDLELSEEGSKSSDALSTAQVLPRTDLTGGVSIPLWIGISLREEGRLQTSLRNGFTPQPSQMSMGATWDPTFASAMGTILGQELQAVGINLLLGPDLDITSQASLLPAGVSATTTFGADSWWVGQNGHAFIHGVQDGSGRSVLVFPRHFPGQGSRDRQPDEELSTIQGALEDLRRHELIPFAQVAGWTETASGEWPVGVANGFVTSHIRYSGFLRSRERTPPISLSDQLGDMLALEEFQGWHQQGGLVLSDALGVRAIRRYYDPSEESFLAQRIAYEAFQAGNDLLWLDQYADGSDTVSIRETIEFFQTQYLEKPDFAEAVNDAVRRILLAKLQRYPLRILDTTETIQDADSGTFSVGLIPGLPPDKPETSLIGFHPLDSLAKEQELAAFTPESLALKRSVVARVAQGGVTLLYSNWTQAGDLLPAEPSVNDRLVIFTDSRPQDTCHVCNTEPILAPGMVEESILRLFGPGATQQIAPNQIASFTLAQLSALLNQSSDGTARLRLDRALNNADWILFATLDLNVEEHLPSDAVSQFLRQRAGLVAEKQVAVLALDAPYILDGTDVSKLAAYIGAYSPTEVFVETAVRALFRDLEFQGAPPVDVPGTRYSSLIERLEPDPNQVIPLTLYDEKRSDFALEFFDVHLGDTIILKAGPIVDRNGHPVPDGTPVQFLLKYSGSGLNLRTDPVPSREGYGLVEVLLDRPEVLEVAASSIDSHTSVALQINVGEVDSAQITSVEPEMPVPEGPGPEELVPVPVTDLVTARWFALEFGQFIVSFLVLIACLGAYFLLAHRHTSTSAKLFCMMWAVVASTLAYLIYGVASELALDTSGSNDAILWMVTPVVALTSVLVLTVLHRRDQKSQG